MLQPVRSLPALNPPRETAGREATPPLGTGPHIRWRDRRAGKPGPPPRPVLVPSTQALCGAPGRRLPCGRPATADWTQPRWTPRLVVAGLLAVGNSCPGVTPRVAVIRSSVRRVGSRADVMRAASNAAVGEYVGPFRPSARCVVHPTPRRAEPEVAGSIGPGVRRMTLGESG